MSGGYLIGSLIALGVLVCVYIALKIVQKNREKKQKEKDKNKEVVEAELVENKEDK